MTDKRNGKHVNFREPAHEILMDRAKRLSEQRGQLHFPGLTAYILEASEFFERKRDVL